MILEISNAQERVIKIEKIRHTSTVIAEMYADVSDKTIKRDIERLVELGLLIKEEKSVKCNLDALRAFFTKVGETQTKEI